MKCFPCCRREKNEEKWNRMEEKKEEANVTKGEYQLGWETHDPQTQILVFHVYQ